MEGFSGHLGAGGCHLLLASLSLPGAKQHPGQELLIRARLYLGRPSLNGSFDKGSLTSGGMTSEGITLWACFHLRSFNSHRTSKARLFSSSTEAENGLREVEKPNKSHTAVRGRPGIRPCLSISRTSGLLTRQNISSSLQELLSLLPQK